MTRSHPHPGSFTLLLTALLMLGLSPLRGIAATWDAWATTQTLDVEAAGWVRVLLSPGIFDAAQEGLADLRLADPAGDEVPYLIQRPRPVQLTRWRHTDIAATLPGRSTQFEIPLTNPPAVRLIRLETPAPELLKAVSLDAISISGSVRTIVGRRAVFRQRGVEGLSIRLEGLLREGESRLRVTLDDSRSRPIVVSAMEVEEAATPGEPPVEVEGRVVDRTEGPGETRLTVDWGAGRLPLTGIRLGVTDPAFSRRVRVMTQDWTGDGLVGRALLVGWIHRVGLEGAANAENLELGGSFLVPGRESTMVVENGDSPPLDITRVTALCERTYLVFSARQPGSFRLHAGNSQARAPRYDLAGFESRLRTGGVLNARTGTLGPNPAYAPGVGLADIPVFGGAMDFRGWRHRVAVVLGDPGVQRLKIPLQVLSEVRPDLGDLRLVSEQRQVLFAGDPHAHDWGRPPNGGRPTNDDRGLPRPPQPGDPPCPSGK